MPGNRQLQVFIFVQAFRWPTLPATMWACAGHAKVAELVDALDLGSSEGDLVRVRVPPFAPSGRAQIA